ncbi:MAG: sugar-binding protein [Flavobacteriaceae bacterium]|nr:sugar-binding protein [Flavobacteriaceae bacterium]
MRHLLLLFSSLCSLFLTAQKTLPTFDGIVSDAEWINAEKFNINYEIEPGNNEPSTHETKVFITYSKTDLYVGFIAYADMKKLRSSIRNRDEGYLDDNVMIGIDTYGDGRYMISLGSNPEGNQLDLKFSSSGDSDSSYNLSFESKASKHKNSYHVELKIPFAVLQFNKADEMKWNVLLYRSTYTDENRSQNINFPIDLNNPCLPCQTKSNITLKNIESKNRVSLLPYVFGGLSGFQENENLSYEKPFGDVGLSGLFDLNNTTSLEYAINPDFSQVEADVSQITANNTFAVFFEERRAYFNEGNDIIDTRLNTVYTRSINKPTFSSKLITQGEKQRIYWLAAYDEASPYLIAGENRSYFGKGGASFSNVFRYQRTFDRGSNIGFLTTNRFFKEGGSGNTIGVDGIYRFKESYTASFEFNKSITQEPIANWIDENEQIKDKNTLLDGEESQGDAFYFSIQRNTKNWNSEIEYEQYSPHYQTPIGFVTQNSIRFLSVNHGYQHFFNKKNYVKQLGLYLGSIISYNYENLLKYQEIGTSIDLQLSGNIETGIEYNFIISEEFEGFNGTNMNDLEFFVSYNPSERVSLRLFTNVGESIVYNEENPATGNNLFIGTFNSFQITPQLTISPSFRYSQLKNKSDDSFYFRGYIARTEINYQFNNTLSFRLIGEFNEFEENFFYQPLLKWNPNPFTIFYIGGTNGYSILNTNNKYGIENSQLYFKFQYQFDL